MVGGVRLPSLEEREAAGEIQLLQEPLQRIKTVLEKNSDKQVFVVPALRSVTMFKITIT